MTATAEMDTGTVEAAARSAEYLADEMRSLAVLAAKRNGNRPMCEGLFLTRDGGMVATDGRVLGRMEPREGFPGLVGGYGKQGYVVRADQVAKIPAGSTVTVLDDDATVGYLTATAWHPKKGITLHRLDLIDGPYPNWVQVVPSLNPDKQPIESLSRITVDVALVARFEQAACLRDGRLTRGDTNHSGIALTFHGAEKAVEVRVKEGRFFGVMMPLRSL